MDQRPTLGLGLIACHFGKFVALSASMIGLLIRAPSLINNVWVARHIFLAQLSRSGCYERDRALIIRINATPCRGTPISALDCFTQGKRFGLGTGQTKSTDNGFEPSFGFYLTRRTLVVIPSDPRDTIKSLARSDDLLVPLLAYCLE